MIYPQQGRIQATYSPSPFLWQTVTQVGQAWRRKQPTRDPRLPGYSSNQQHRRYNSSVARSVDPAIFVQLLVQKTAQQKLNGEKDCPQMVEWQKAGIIHMLTVCRIF